MAHLIFVSIISCTALLVVELLVVATLNGSVNIPTGTLASFIIMLCDGIFHISCTYRREMGTSQC